MPFNNDDDMLNFYKMMTRKSYHDSSDLDEIRRLSSQIKLLNDKIKILDAFEDIILCTNIEFIPGYLCDLQLSSKEIEIIVNDMKTFIEFGKFELFEKIPDKHGLRHFALMTRYMSYNNNKKK